MTLIEAILWKIKGSAIGRNHAICRKDLLQYLYDIGIIYRITESIDREMRAIIENHPEICSCEDGYFYDGGPEDVAYSVEYIRKKAIPLLVKINRRKMAYPQYYPDFDPKQGELFDEENIS